MGIQMIASEEKGILCVFYENHKKIFYRAGHISFDACFTIVHFLVFFAKIFSMV
jgi:hypothetical protein